MRDFEDRPALAQLLAVVGALFLLLGLGGAVLLWRATDEPMGLALAIGAAASGLFYGLLLMGVGALLDEFRALNEQLEGLGRELESQKLRGESEGRSVFGRPRGSERVSE